jgi:hypothetical protein
VNCGFAESGVFLGESSPACDLETGENAQTEATQIRGRILSSFLWHTHLWSLRQIVQSRPTVVLSPMFSPCRGRSGGLGAEFIGGLPVVVGLRRPYPLYDRDMGQGPEA